ncbi:unnamed protein product, partial [Didymodactylos carnosus]
MTTIAAIPAVPSSFGYNDLVSQVQAIQYQMVQMENEINSRLENETKKQSQLKFRSITFRDPYGNQMVNEHMDHELINKITRKYKINYVPKYLQRWAQIGSIDHD